MRKIIILFFVALIASPVQSDEISNKTKVPQEISSLRNIMYDLGETELQGTTDVTKLYPLMGYWDFTYTLISTWTDTYKLYDIYESDEGEYYVAGYDVDLGASALASYYEDSGHYALLARYSLFDQFFTFNFTGTNTVSGTYYMVINDDLGYGYPFMGIKTEEIDPPTTTSIQPTTTITPTSTTTTMPIPDTFSMSGCVTGDLISNISIALSGTASKTILTDTARGCYGFSDLESGYYTITPEMEGYGFTPPNYQIQNLNSDLQDMDFVSTRIKPVSPCALELIYGEDSSRVRLLKFIRDNILSKTIEGREIIRLYYKWNSAIIEAIENDPEAEEKIKELVNGIIN